MTDSAGQLLEIVGELLRELHPGRDTSFLSLDSSLDRDLGLDSLARVELLVRIERSFDLAIPEGVLNTAVTPRDLLREISRARRRHAGIPGRLETRERRVSAGGSGEVPLQARTLTEVLDWHGAVHPDRPHIRFYEDEGEGGIITYGELRHEAGRVAAGLHGEGLEPGDTVILMLPTGREYFLAFAGVLLAGAVPVPVYPPGHVRQLEEHLRRHVAIAENSLAAFMITVPEASRFARLALGHLPRMRSVATMEELLEAGVTKGTFSTAPASADDTAFLQYTSGSTGIPKGVVLSHANLLANIRSMGTAIRVTPADVFVSWLPLYHDMGLIGAWLGSLHYGCELVIMSPLSFIARPRRWFRAIHRYGGTLSAAPNFAYELCLRRIEEGELEGLDLGSWRCAFNGAEAVSPVTLERFTARFGPLGFRPETMMPVFGLAENAVGLTFPPLGRQPPVDVVRRNTVMNDGIAEPAGPEHGASLRFVGCGQPLPGHQIRVVDAAGRELPDRHEGRLQFRGPSATSGYFRNPEQTAELFDGNWLNSGDLAYIAGGELYVTGRTKDLVIRAGRNIHPVEIEEAVGAVEGVREGCVAVFGINDPEAGTEKLVVLAETRKREDEVRETLRQEIIATVSDLCGLPPDEVVLAPPNTVLKTSSGKIRRGASRDLYERGGIGKRRRPPWFQALRFSFSSMEKRLHRGLRSAMAVLYAAYCWLTFLPLASAVWIVIATLPRWSWRWGIAHRSVRLLAVLLGIPIVTEGEENHPLPGTPCVLVSNHASYLDGFVLVGTIRAGARFVAKAELRGNFFARVGLERMGGEFVERFDPEKGLEDFRRLTETARRGRPLLFFPEGTFDRMPGLLPFRMGSFETAARAGLPVVPVVIRGTRSILRAGSWFPRRGVVRVLIGPPVVPGKEGDWEAAIRMRDQVREWILEHCGEPDLGHERGAVFSDKRPP